MKTCSVCKVGTMKKTLIDTVERVSQKGFVNLKNVPCKECDNCGHLTFSTEVEKKIEQLINNSEEVGDKFGDEMFGEFDEDFWECTIEFE